MFKTISQEKTVKYQIVREGHPLKVSEFIALLKTSREFRQFFTATLLSAYFWETRPVTAATVDQIFEFVKIY